ncbi:uncharacterized protein LOC119985382 isoform X2 [Tripterygium wilfordii]|nr:uncharacterized protein LOC119985382 isoform X2 [Tripterygium wilfordii]XP_038685598.1 uncharacterized protein LOC119985382 isoform X2 [Tripterygium wilfordii]XP_038685599.1 uncharacterized protein LOC119985382 isoform X2 [Tripterygium wilfordii]XP_038685600.1 uncharacterized protein LOC119985382 isoform X2 [Tripterygium wilfordii]XP_038685601.1 uncharacterized protein LOC119985382 isoform X2 [Tripterygium wilfordii]XP_038685602.1 uncharacterized protein LOC119985382 isoform X2 [Tripterygiu
MDYTPLRNLEIGQRGSTIIVRVARMWDSTNPSQQDQLMSVDLIFVDEQGTTIQGSIRKEDADRIKEFLLEGHIYKISNFFVGAARKTFKVSKHEHIIRIGTWTIISEMSDTKDDIPMNCFNFVDDQVLESRLYNDVELTDVMGHLTSVSRLTTTFANGRMGKKFITVASIAEIDASKGWWYNACPKCKVGISNYQGKMSCNKCGPTEKMPIPWYKVNVNVTDGIHGAKFLLFGKHFERLINIPAGTLSELPTSVRTEVPEIMQNLYGKTYNFTVSINERDNNSDILTFNVSQVYEDEKLMTNDAMKRKALLEPSQCQILETDGDNAMGNNFLHNVAKNKRKRDVVKEEKKNFLAKNKRRADL